MRSPPAIGRGAGHTLSLVNAAELTATIFKTYLVPCAELAQAMAEAGRFHQEAAGAIKDRPEAERVEAHEQLCPPVRARVGGVPAQLGGDEGAGARARGDRENSLGGQHGEEVASATGGACAALPGEAVQEDSASIRVTLPLEPALEAALLLQKGIWKHGPPRGPLEREASKLLAQMRGEAERLARRLEAASQRMADLLRLEVLEPSLAYAFLMKTGGQQVPPGTDEEGDVIAPDMSPPRIPPERPPVAFVRRETLEPSTARPKVRISRKSRAVQSSSSSTDEYSSRSVVVFSFAQQIAWPPHKDDTQNSINGVLVFEGHFA